MSPWPRIRDGEPSEVAMVLGVVYGTYDAKRCLLFEIEQVVPESSWK